MPVRRACGADSEPSTNPGELAGSDLDADPGQRH